MSRRQFLFTPLLLLPLGLGREDMEEKVKNSKRLSLESLLQIKQIPPLKEVDFSLFYELFRDDSNISLGTASINFNREKRVMDFGLDNFSLLAGSYLWVASIFSKKYSPFLEMQKVRFFTEFDENMKWTTYKENVPKEEGKSPASMPYHRYDSIEKKIFLDGKEILSNKRGVQNPLSVAFEILNGNLLENVELLEAEKTSKVHINYSKEGKVNDLVTLEVDSSRAVLARFKKIYGILYNNIPVSGYLEGVVKKGDDPVYLRGDLTGIKVNGNEMLNL